ncbi:MAG: hypothetical protein NZM42_08830, partial [Gemmatales bacterium]|nr:hypothetical protein [Gemmatales bacterium]
PGWVRRLAARWFPSWQALHGLTPNPNEASVHLAGRVGEESHSSYAAAEQKPIAVAPGSFAKSSESADSA